VGGAGNSLRRTGTGVLRECFREDIGWGWREREGGVCVCACKDRPRAKRVESKRDRWGTKEKTEGVILIPRPTAFDPG